MNDKITTGMYLLIDIVRHGDINSMTPGYNGQHFAHHIFNNSTAVTKIEHISWVGLQKRHEYHHLTGKPGLLQWYHIDGLVQERRNSSALAMELRLSCTNPSTWVSWCVKSPASRFFFRPQTKCGKHFHVMVSLCVLWGFYKKLTNITVTSYWVWWHLKSPESRLFTLNCLFKRRSKKTSKLRHWPLGLEFPNDQWIPHTKGE